MLQFGVSFNSTVLPYYLANVAATLEDAEIA